MNEEELLIKYGLVELLPKKRKADSTESKGNLVDSVENFE